MRPVFITATAVLTLSPLPAPGADQNSPSPAADHSLMMAQATPKKDPEPGAEAATPLGAKTPERLTKEELQELAPPVGYLKARKDLQDPLTLLGGPVDVRVTQTAGTTRIILPGRREMEMRVFGTPDLPRSFAGTPGAEGVPLSMRGEKAGEYTQTKKKTPASDEWIEAKEGKLSLHAVDISATDAPGSRDQIHFEAEWKGPDGASYGAKCDKVIPIGVEYPVFGGVVTNHLLHGFTRIATPLMPTEFAYVATWCMGTIWKNGNQVDGPRPIHTMLTEYVRDESYNLVHDENVSPKRVHFHLMVPPVKPGKERWEFEIAPVSTGFTLSSGKEMPFWHVMFEDVEVAAERLAVQRSEQQLKGNTPEVKPVR